MTDDIDGKTKANVTTHRIMIDGEEWELELGTVNLGKLVKALEEYIPHARGAGAGRPDRSPHRRRERTSPPKAAGNGHVMASSDEIRAWLRANGHEVASRGRISATLVDTFKRNQPHTPWLTDELNRAIRARCHATRIPRPLT